MLGKNVDQPDLARLACQASNAVLIDVAPPWDIEAHLVEVGVRLGRIEMQIFTLRAVDTGQILSRVNPCLRLNNEKAT